MISGMLGLRVDVDTHDGMRDGVPHLLEIMAEEGVQATFYFALGPDHVAGLHRVSVFVQHEQIVILTRRLAVFFLYLALNSPGRLIALFFHPRNFFLTFLEGGTRTHTHENPLLICGRPF